MSRLIIDRNPVFGETITVQASKLDECIKYINDNNTESVYIWDWKYDSGDITFLKECQSVKRVNINNRFVKEVTALQHLKQLEELTLETFACIDLSFLQSLKSLSADYPRIKGITDLKRLNELYLWDYVADNEFEDMSCLPELKYLDLIQPHISTLKGIGKLKNIKYLEIAYARKLTDISSIGDLTNSLVELRIEHCKKINDFSSIGKLNSLKELALCHDGEMDSISFIKDMPELKSFIFMDTNVLDGNVSYCKKLEHAMFTNKRHFSHKTRDFKQNNEKCRW